MSLDALLTSPMDTSPAPVSHPPINASASSDSKIKESFALAWNGFQLLSKKVESFLDGTPFKTPVAVLNVLIDIGNVR